MAACGFCKGTGEISFASMELPAVICAHRCLACNGTGKAPHWTDWALANFIAMRPLFGIPAKRSEEAAR